jgi:hypothetical protein
LPRTFQVLAMTRGVSLRGVPIHRGDEAISEGLLRREIAALRIRSARNGHGEETPKYK